MNLMSFAFVAPLVLPRWPQGHSRRPPAPQPVPLPHLMRPAVNDDQVEATPDRLFEEGPSGLLAAADQKCWLRVQQLVEAGVEVNHRDQKGRTALWLCVWHHAPLPVVELLVAAGADVNRANPQGITPLWHAISHHPNRQVAECLWQAGAFATPVTWTGHTLLMAAAAHGDAVWVHRLLAAGLDARDQDEAEMTALDHAQANHHHAVVALLHEHTPSASGVVVHLPLMHDPVLH